jgi:hypothetical protein
MTGGLVSRNCRCRVITVFPAAVMKALGPVAELAPPPAVAVRVPRRAAPRRTGAPGISS